MESNLQHATVCVLGLGYVGLPLAEAFSRKLEVIGYDINSNRVRKLKQGPHNPKLFFTDDPREMSKADFIIIAVPTPVTQSKEPDLSYVQSAARTVSQHMKKGCTVVLESTVYPGVTEDIMKPILEKSGLACGKDFKIAYSPERINPADEEHTIDKVTKVVAGMDEETTNLVAELYQEVAPRVFKAKNIKTAEAAKVIENIQRDLNIALMNELSLIFSRMDLNIRDVYEAASTKWNFHKFHPGMVGGHCIPVDPYYLVYKAHELGYHPQVILAGRAINDHMPKHVAEMTVKGLIDVDKRVKNARVLVMGLAYKANVPDTREAPSKELVKHLAEYGVEVLGFDPLLDNIEAEFGIKSVSAMEDVSGVDATIIVVPHNRFNITLDKLKSVMNSHPILIDIPGLFSKTAELNGLYYRTL